MSSISFVHLKSIKMWNLNFDPNPEIDTAETKISTQLLKSAPPRPDFDPNPEIDTPRFQFHSKVRPKSFNRHPPISTSPSNLKISAELKNFTVKSWNFYRNFHCYLHRISMGNFHGEFPRIILALQWKFPSEFPLKFSVHKSSYNFYTFSIP